jgi:hypothetical protein
MPTIRSRAAAGVAAAVFLAGLNGCGNDTANQVAAMNKSNAQRLGNLYAAHQNYHGGRGPADEAEFKAFIKDFDPAKLSIMHVDPNDLDKLFTSERDGQPFAIRYQVGGGRGSVDPVVFELGGKDGKKQVGYTGGGKVDEVDEATYSELWAGKSPGGGGRPVGAPAGAPTGPGK